MDAFVVRTQRPTARPIGQQQTICGSKAPQKASAQVTAQEVD